MFSSYPMRACTVVLLLLSTACNTAPSPKERSAQLTAEAIDMMMHTRPAEPPSVWSRAAALLEEAVVLDSTNGVAYASMVLPNIMMPTVNERNAEEAEEKGRAAIERALILNPNSPDVVVAHAIALSLYDNDYDAAGHRAG